MRDVAERCGVSISTVSLVLSGDPRIPEDTARAVLQAVKALEYRPSVVARNLARRSSRTIAVILPEFAFQENQMFYNTAIRGIHAQTQPAGYKIVVEAANQSFLERRYYHRLLKEQSVDGVIYMAAAKKDLYLSDMKAEPYPFVLLGGEADESDLEMIRGMMKRGAAMAAEHLIKLGHKKIGVITGLNDFSYSADREKGFLEAAKNGGIDISKSSVLSGDFNLANPNKRPMNWPNKA